MILMVVGILDPIVGFLIVCPRAAESSRKTIQISFTLSGVAMLVLGLLFLTGVIGVS
jgi:hypothetical protein